MSSRASRSTAAGLSLLLLGAAAARAEATIWPGANWQTATPAQRGMDATILAQARTYALTGGGAGMVIRSGYVVDSWGDTSALYELKSTTKSIGGMLLSMAISDGRVALDQTMLQYYPGAGVPRNRTSARAGCRRSRCTSSRPTPRASTSRTPSSRSSTRRGPPGTTATARWTGSPTS